MSRLIIKKWVAEWIFAFIYAGLAAAFVWGVLPGMFRTNQERTVWVSVFLMIVGSAHLIKHLAELVWHIGGFMHRHRSTRD